MINVEIEWKYRGDRGRGLNPHRPSSPGPPATETNWPEVVGLNALTFFLVKRDGFAIPRWLDENRSQARIRGKLCITADLIDI